jgi:hypothetical protein
VSQATTPGKQIRRHRGKILVATGVAAFAAVTATLSPSGDYSRTFLYVACTLAVCGCATVVTIGLLRRLFEDAAGVVEFGAMIGLFVIAPAALLGAFQILEAVIGAL